MYRCEAFANVPKSRRRAALSLQIPAWSPFERTEHYCVWSGDTAMIWLWDADVVRPQGETLGLTDLQAARLRIVPETVLLQRKPDGVHLQGCRHGFELQHWRGNVLCDSFWLPEPPDLRQWDRFLHRLGSDVPDQAMVPDAAEAVMGAEPWAAPLTPKEWLEANERMLTASCLLALAVFAVWQEARLWRIHRSAGNAAAEFAAMEAELGPLLAARTELLRLRRLDRRLADILAEPSQARLMTLVDQAIPSENARFQQWSYRQRELAVIVQDPSLDPIASIKALEAVPMFDQVRAKSARGADSIEIMLRVQP